MASLVPKDTLDANPQFADLCNTLFIHHLNPCDASSRSVPVDSELEQELRTHRAELAKSQLLHSSLSHLTSRATTLTAELQETLDLLISPYYRKLPEKDRVLLQDEFEELEDSLDEVGRQLSSSLHKSALEIARVAYPGEEPEALERKLEILPGETAHRIHSLQKERHLLAEKQTAFTSTCSKLLETYNSLTALLLHANTTQAPAITKALTTQTTQLSLVAQNLALKLEVLKYQAMQSIYDPEAINALENYSMHLRDTFSRLKPRERKAEEALKAYTSAGGDMKRLVEKHAEVVRKLQAVKKDLERLGKM